MAPPEPADRKKRAKTTILIVVLIALSAFLVINRDYLKNRVENDFFESEETPTQTVSILGEHTVEQPFVAQSGSIGSIGIFFNNEQRNTATGKIKVELLDSGEKVVAATDLDANLVQESAATRFILGGDSDVLNGNHIVDSYGKNSRMSRIFLKKGQTYTFRITSEKVKSEGAFDMLVCDIPAASENTISGVSIDDKSHDGQCLYMYTKNDIYSMKTVALFIALIILTAVFVMLPFEKIDEKTARILKRESFCLSAWISRVIFITTPMAAYFIMQKYVEYDVAKFIRHLASDSLKGPLNLLIIGFMLFFIYTLSGSVRISSMLTTLFFSAFGFVNYMLILFRGTPLVYTDLEQIRTAMQVADSYEITLTKHFLWAIMLTVTWCVICMAPPKHKGMTWKGRLVSVAVLAIWGSALYYSIFTASFIEDHNLKVSSFKPKNTYYRNGCALAFMITWKNTVVKEPEGYDPSNIEALAEKYPSDEAAETKKVSKKTPNVIVVMNESFADLSVLGEFETNEDFLPFYRSLEENTTKGWMYSSVFGGGTANSEFECLTGFSLRFLPFQSVAYRSIIKDETPSLTRDMKALGYGGNIAFHPGEVDSYNRNNVYPLLGFDRHISVDDMNDPEKIRDFVSDSCDYEFVESEYEKFRKDNSGKPFYMFNVTIQNHGGYTYKLGEVDNGIKIRTPDLNYEQASQFLNLMKYSDEALEELIEYFSNVDEETVIVLYGDHQPRVDDEFYSELKAQHKGISAINWEEEKHKVPVMIWTNFDSGSKDKNKKGSSKDSGELHISANYIAPILKEMLGMPLTGFDKYLLDLREQLPVINEICYEDADGKVYDPDKESKYDELLNEYEQIQYNGLIDSENRVDEFFTLKK